FRLKRRRGEGWSVEPMGVAEVAGLPVRGWLGSPATSATDQGSLAARKSGDFRYRVGSGEKGLAEACSRRRFVCDAAAQCPAASAFGRHQVEVGRACPIRSTANPRQQVAAPLAVVVGAARVITR